MLISVGVGMLSGLGQGWSRVGGIALLVTAIYPVGMCLLMLHGSLVVKVRDRDRILDLIDWSGTERVLDIGCGRGLMLVGAARRLTTGRATGIDIWSARDQGGNNAARPLENATIEGVADRVDVVTADMRTLPFENASFDVVVSNWVVHNIEDADERDRALVEMVRVTRHGGTILLTDIVDHNAYRDRLIALGCFNATVVMLSRVRYAVLRVITFGSFAPVTVRATCAAA